MIGRECDRMALLDLCRHFVYCHRLGRSGQILHKVNRPSLEIRGTAVHWQYYRFRPGEFEQ